MIDKINVYIASKDKVLEDVFVYPKTGNIIRESDNYNSVFNQYIRDNKLYTVIDGIMYNTAKLIYDSVNRDNLPKTRYKVIVTDGNISHPTIDNIAMTDIRYNQENNYTHDENINIMFDGIDTEINVEYLLKMLADKKYEVTRNE